MANTKIFCIVLAALCLLLSKAYSLAQSKVSASQSQKESQGKKAQNTPLVDGGPDIAQAALEQLDFIVSDLKQLDDLYLILPLAQAVVKKLAPHRPEQCRELLEALFAKSLSQVERAEEKPGKGPSKYVYEANLRVLIGAAASFDPELSQKFIERFTDSKKYSRVWNKSDASLFLANEVAGADPGRAVNIAGKFAGEQFTVAALEFIGSLREKNPQLAKFYLSTLMQSLESRKYPSVNELFLLYSYVFLSKSIPAISSGGIGFIQNVAYGDGLDRQIIDTDLAVRYLQLAVGLMLQQDRYADAYGPDKADVRADLLFIETVLLPKVKLYLPAVTEALLQRRNYLASLLDPIARNTIQSSVDRFSRTINSNSAASGEELVSQADDIKNDPERKMQLYYEAALAACKRKEFSRARDIVRKISSPKVESIAEDFILFEIIKAEIKDHNLNEAKRWLADYRDPVDKAYLLTLIAASLTEGKEKDAQQIGETLAEVSGIASKLAPGIEKVSILAGIAAVYSRVDPARAIGYLGESIEAANKAEKFDGNLGVTRVLYINRYYYGHYLYRDELNFNEVFSRLAREHFQSLLIEAKTLDAPVARIKAIVALCSAVI